MVDRTISDKHVVKTAPVEVSVLSTLPPGLDEGRYRSGTLIEDELAISAGQIDGSTIIDEVLPETPTDGPADGDTSLAIPTNIRVKEQTFWFGEGGIPFVDVVLEFDGSAGAHAYEVRWVAE